MKKCLNKNRLKGELEFLTKLLECDWDPALAYRALHPRVSVRRAELLGAEEMGKLRARDIYRNLIVKVVRNINALLDSADERIRLTITRELMDRLYGKPKDGLHLESLRSPFTTEELDTVLEELAAKAA